jgi:hypothetical protein
MQELKLYMILLGCRPEGRHIEQHDMFFVIGRSLKEIVPAINEFWPEAKGNIHIDAWREVTNVEGYDININLKTEVDNYGLSLFFINLGGYKKDEFEEYHYKVIVVAKDVDEAKARAKETAFYQHTGIKGAPSHIDDKYGVDADDIHAIEDILPKAMREKYSIEITPSARQHTDEVYLGYLPIFRIKG